jgi:hypothetical protein
LVTLCLLAGCGGGPAGGETAGGATSGGAISSDAAGGSTGVAAVVSDSSAPADGTSAQSSAFSVGEAIGVSLTPGAAQGNVTAEIDQAPTDVVVDGDEAVVVVPDLAPGTHSLTLHVRGQQISLSFDVGPGQPPSGDARQNVADMIAEALRLLDEYLAAHPDDAAAADLRAQLAAAQALLASMTDAELQALYQLFTANPLPPSDAPGSCAAASAGYEVRVNAFLRKARLTSWLAARHAAQKTDASRVAVVLAEARMEEALRRLVAYTNAITGACNGTAELAQRTENARGRSHRSANAAAASLR